MVGINKIADYGGMARCSQLVMDQVSIRVGAILVAPVIFDALRGRSEEPRKQDGDKDKGEDE